VKGKRTKGPLVSLKDVHKSYTKGKPVLGGISFDVARGEFIYVTGPSGAGKSTFLKLLYRAEEPDRGEVHFCGRDLTRLARDSVPYLRRNVGVVFQDFRLLSDRTVHDNVALALEVLGARPRDIRTRVAYVLDRVGLRDRERDLVGGLSGGEQQRVAVARAVIAGPALILADEPTGNLDSLRAAEVLSLLDAVQRRGTAVILATHDHMLMAARPRRTVVLSRGKVLDFPKERADEALEMAELRAAAEASKRKRLGTSQPTMTNDVDEADDDEPDETADRSWTGDHAAAG